MQNVEYQLFPIRTFATDRPDYGLALVDCLNLWTCDTTVAGKSLVMTSIDQPLWLFAPPSRVSTYSTSIRRF